MDNCIFCKIINNEVESYTVYENEKVKAFLDIFPASLGHVLIVPKKHYENIYDIEDEYLVEVVRVAKKIANDYKNIFGINNLQLIHSAGKYGQQEVFHFHLHLIPRKDGDGLNLLFNPNVNLREKFDEFIKKLNN